MAGPFPIPFPDTDAPAREDHVVLLRGTWADYERILRMRGDRSAPRISYLDGEIEIMSPSHVHEGIKSLIARLVDVWCLERGVEFSTYGSWTLKRQRKKAGAEPDECYVFGAHDWSHPPRPDLAIEVIWSTRTSSRKLEIYRRLGVRELWLWEKGAIAVRVLRKGHYTAASHSRVLPGIDLDLLASFIPRRSTSAAIRAYRAALRRREAS